MIGNKNSKHKFFYSFLTALILHAAILTLFKQDFSGLQYLYQTAEPSKDSKRQIKLDQIDFLQLPDIKTRTVGIKDGKKNLHHPDLQNIKRPIQMSPQETKSKASSSLSLENLAPSLPNNLPDAEVKKPTSAPNELGRQMSQKLLRPEPSNENAHFYFNYKDKKVIPKSEEQEVLKDQALKNFNIPSNKATDRISNFEIRYERPEGVSEDELNSDEKAYYSFYLRSYKNYFSKLYSTYEKVVIGRPGLAKAFDKTHLLIGKIDYDENGNIVTVRILKSSESDDLHHFFEETLKQLNQPNPPKFFTKDRKEFSIYYQIKIN